MGDHWLERFENSRAASNWNAQQTKSYFYNALWDKALLWYRMLSVVKINTDKYEVVRLHQELRCSCNSSSQDPWHCLQLQYQEAKWWNYGSIKGHPGATWRDFGSLQCLSCDHLMTDSTFELQANCKKRYLIPGSSILHCQTSQRHQPGGHQIGYNRNVPTIPHHSCLQDGGPRQAGEGHWHHKNQQNGCWLQRQACQNRGNQRKHQQKRMFHANNSSAYQQCSNEGNGSSYSNCGNGNNIQNRNGGNKQSGSGFGAPCKPNPALSKTCHYCK